MLDGIIASQTNLPKTKVAMNSLATMFKAPIVASLQEGLNNYVKTGRLAIWKNNSRCSRCHDKFRYDIRTIWIDCSTFEGIDYINTNEDNGTAEAG